MKKGLWVFRNIILGIVLVFCLIVLVGRSILILNTNEYGFTQFGDKVLVAIDKENASKKYKTNQLVVVEKITLIDLDGNDEVFVYETRNDKVKVVYSNVVEINKNDDEARAVLKNGRLLQDDEFIVGKAVDTYKDLGKVLIFLENNFIFFISLIVFILLLVWLIYSLIFGRKNKKEVINEQSISESKKALLTEVKEEKGSAYVPVIVEATSDEPAMVISDDFGAGYLEPKSITPALVEVKEETNVITDVVDMQPIILKDVNNKIEVEELTEEVEEKKNDEMDEEII